MDQFRLDDKVAVVTGSGQGIGRAIAWALADAGCNVVINSRRRNDLEVTAAGIEERGQRALIADGDIRDFSATIAERAVAEFGSLDIWVNNVGGSNEKVTRTLKILNADPAQFEKAVLKPRMKAGHEWINRSMNQMQATDLIDQGPEPVFLK